MSVQAATRTGVSSGKNGHEAHSGGVGREKGRKEKGENMYR